MGHGHRLPGIESQGHRSMSRVRVRVSNSGLTDVSWDYGQTLGLQGRTTGSIDGNILLIFIIISVYRQLPHITNTYFYIRTDVRTGVQYNVFGLSVRACACVFVPLYTSVLRVPLLRGSHVQGGPVQANALLKDEESAQDNHVLLANLPNRHRFKFFSLTDAAINLS